PAGAREEAQVVDEERDLGLGETDRLADVGGLERRELVARLLDAIRELEQHERAVLGRRVLPLRERRRGRVDGAVHVLRGPLRDLPDALLVDRADDRLVGAVDRGDHLAVDEVLVAIHAGSFLPLQSYSALISVQYSSMSSVASPMSSTNSHRASASS